MNKKEQSNKTMIESCGIEQVPENARNLSVLSMFKMMLGGGNTFPTAVIGALPIMFGLSVQAGLIAVFLGILIGSLILAPMGIFGAVNGTNNAVSSVAHFGVKGRVIGSVLALLAGFTFFCISIWSASDALVGSIQRLTGATLSTSTSFIVDCTFAALAILMCIVGFKVIVLIKKTAMWFNTSIFLLGFYAFSDYIDWGYTGTVQLGQSGFWVAFFSAIIVAMSNPISWGAFLGDWARYIPSNTPKSKICLAVFLGQMSTLTTCMFGLVTASVVATLAPDSKNFVAGLLATAPAWYFYPLLLLALIGGLSTSSGSMYGAGLDTSNLFAGKLKRVPATLLIAIFTVSFLIIGRIEQNIVGYITTLCMLIITCTTPWVVIMLIGLFRNKSKYNHEHLQKFMKGEKGGIYWFSNGYNWRAIGAWVPSAILGVCLLNIPGVFVGPMTGLFGSLDLSLPISLLLSGILYMILLKVYPESNDIHMKNNDINKIEASFNS
jgi:purine-cytosine permease-like protein